MRRIAIVSIGLGGVLGIVAGCEEPKNGILSHLPDPAVHSTPKKAEATRVPIAIIKPKPVPVVRAPSVPGEPGWMPAGGISNRWECIIIHHSDTPMGSAASFDSAHRQRGWDELGYHFVIDNGSGGPDGRVEVGSRWDTQKHGAHCKVPGNYYNEHGIGICLVGDFERSYPTSKQMESLRKLVTFLMVHGKIPASHILGHREANGNNTKCPGRNFSMDQFRSAMGASKGQPSIAYGQ